MGKRRSRVVAPCAWGVYEYVSVVLGVLLVFFLWGIATMRPCPSSDPLVPVVVEGPEYYDPPLLAAQKDCPSAGSYQFPPCKCAAFQGAAINPPRPLSSPNQCFSRPSASLEEMEKAQSGCLANTFSFPRRDVLGVS